MSFDKAAVPLQFCLSQDAGQSRVISHSRENLRDETGTRRQDGVGESLFCFYINTFACIAVNCFYLNVRYRNST